MTDSLLAGAAFSPALRRLADGLREDAAIYETGEPATTGAGFGTLGGAVPDVAGQPMPPRPPRPPEPAAAGALRRDLFALLDAHWVHTTAPDSGLLWSRAPAGPNAAPLLAPAAGEDLFASHPIERRRRIQAHHGQLENSSASKLPLTWLSLLEGEVRATQRDLSRPAHAAQRTGIYNDLSL